MKRSPGPPKQGIGANRFAKRASVAPRLPDVEESEEEAKAVGDGDAGTSTEKANRPPVSATKRDVRVKRASVAQAPSDAQKSDEEGKSTGDGEAGTSTEKAKRSPVSATTRDVRVKRAPAVQASSDAAQAFGDTAEAPDHVQESDEVKDSDDPDA